METIGSRLRKRRRTSPMPNEDIEDPPPPPKRASTRGKRGQAALSQQSVPEPSFAGPQPTVQAASPVPLVSPPSGPPAPAYGIQEVPQEASSADHQLLSGQHPPQDTHPLDINTVFAEIINHGETVETASQGYAAMGMVDTESYSQLGASLHLKLQSLPILDNLVGYYDRQKRLYH